LSSHIEVLRPRKGKWALVLIASAAFVAIGFGMLRDPGTSTDRFVVYGGIVFFGICGLVSLIQFVPGSSFLRLTSDGMTVRSLWRTSSYRWSDIERFGVGHVKGTHGGFGKNQRLIGFDFSVSYPGRDKAQTLKNINRKLSGFEASLPDNYGWDYAELAEHLNTLRERYAGSTPTTARPID
jgi:hypothetical protein